MRWIRGFFERTASTTNVVQASAKNLGLGSEGPLVTIVVPFFRDEKYLRWTLASVASQTYPNWECLLIDDCGGDGSQAIAQEFSDKDQRFRVIAHARNSGLAASRNTGIAQANGQYLQFLDADDMLHTDAIERRLLVMMEFPHENVAGAHCHIVTRGASYCQIKGSDPKKDMTVIDFVTLGGDCPFACHSPLIKTEIVRKFGGFNEELHQAEDYEFWMRVLRHGYCFVPSMTTSGVYRMKPSGSMAVDGSAAHLSGAIRIFETAHRDMDPAAEIEGTPFVYRRPWAYYASAVRKSQRVFQFAAMAADKKDAAALVTEYLPADTMYAVSRHVRAAELAASGIKRAAGVRGSEAPGHVLDYFTDDAWILERAN